MTGDKKVLGILAQFDNPAELLHAAEKVREAGYKSWDCHSPFPIHGMDDAMGVKRSKVGYIAGMCAIFGGGGMLALQGWASTYAYPVVISGKPFFSYQAYFPITFAIAVLSAALGALLGMMSLMKMRFHHPVFYSETFAKFSDDGFFVTIEVDDPQFDPGKSMDFLKSIGASHVENLEADDE
ncbi:DUF3341 domain-containing protein [Calditrichota bacterium]